ncbi:conserved hypothetical protein [Pediculus humanus corporis]|uniref:PH domain-containing protein n=1 Tax=Pediculus humanus subsp. corporis TaxID=121224 RepID=E0VIB9_PEDHC|nr:uncharacterized protein Phum_PHUM225060 [Pediculus humanus corporis]EEB13125.1 conserved hypothetical protein [Pediculus humanus corporis]
MVYRFHDQVFNKMTPEKRARNLCVMKALSRDSMRLNKNKENENPLNNNTTPFNLKHSTPIKYRKITDSNYPERISPVDINTTDSENFLEKKKKDPDEPKLVFAKIYELTPNGETNVIETTTTTTTTTSRNDYSKSSEFEIIVPEKKLQNGELNSRKKESNWKSLNVLNDVAEYEFCKSLEQSKLCLSTSNLLEEIEADLPSHYSLAKPLNHTFHSLESYRTVTRLARNDKNLTTIDYVETDVDEGDEKVLLLKKLDFLEMEATIQKAKIRQAQKAMTLSKNKKSMDVEYFECEKTLLLSGLRLNAALQEMERLKRSQGTANGCFKDNYGQVTIREIVFYVDDVTLNKDGKLYFDQPMKFQNLNKDFVINIQLYKRRGKEGKEPKKIFLMKKLKELAGNTLQKTITTSSVGEKHDFECVASTRLKLENVSNRKQDKCVLKFSEPPQHPVMRDALVLYLKTDFNVETKDAFGFLNVFNNSCWQRWWFSQSGYYLNSWLYPEDEENNKVPVYSLHLPSCTEKVKIADLEVCIRPHSFVVVTGPPNNKEEILFSAESNKDMIKWMNHLNLIIECVRLWKPNA